MSMPPTARGLYHRCRRAGIVLSADGDAVRFRAPPGVAVPVEEIRQIKSELLAVLRCDYMHAALALLSVIPDPEQREAFADLFDGRASICQHTGGMSRGNALRQAYIELAREVEKADCCKDCTHREESLAGVPEGQREPTEPKSPPIATPAVRPTRAIPRLMSVVEGIEFESKQNQRARAMIRQSTRDPDLADALFKLFAGAWTMALVDGNASEQQAVEYGFDCLRRELRELSLAPHALQYETMRQRSLGRPATNNGIGVTRS